MTRATTPADAPARPAASAAPDVSAALDTPGASATPSAAPADVAALADEVCRVGRSLYARGYVHASAGNISVRLDGEPEGGWLITPTDACLGTLEPQRLARIAADGRQLAGERASKTLALHRRIYEADPQARCVIHTHSTHLVALTLDGAWSAEELLPPITPYFVMKVGHVPVIGYRRPGAPEAADAVADAIGAAAARGAPIRAAMLERLGPVVWHATPAEASAVLEELEETARLWWMSGRRCAPLDEARIDELRRTFGARW